MPSDPSMSNLELLVQVISIHCYSVHGTCSLANCTLPLLLLSQIGCLMAGFLAHIRHQRRNSWQFEETLHVGPMSYMARHKPWQKGHSNKFSHQTKTVGKCLKNEDKHSRGWGNAGDVNYVFICYCFYSPGTEALQKGKGTRHRWLTGLLDDDLPKTSDDWARV